MSNSKRLFDFIFAFIGLFFIFPLFILIAIAIKLDSRGSVFFKQKRVGKNGKCFLIYKFRTMIKDGDGIDRAITTKNDPRITRVGKFLRKYKLDELPQLINVLKGEMSIVGPRPEVPKYVEKFKKEFAYILKVKPGITDFASIKFRNENELIEENYDAEKIYIEKVLPPKLVLNKNYVDNQSFTLDLLLILKTIWVLFK